MNTARTIYHLLRADFWERVRRYSFLITLGLTIYLGSTFVPPADANYVTVAMGNVRGVYNSAWIGCRKISRRGREDTRLDAAGNGNQFGDSRRQQGGGGLFSHAEDNVKKQIALPWVSFGSDAASQAPEGVFLRSSAHPREDLLQQARATATTEAFKEHGCSC